MSTTSLRTLFSFSIAQQPEVIIINNVLQQYFYSCVFGKRNYRVLVRVSVCVCVCVCPCVCVCFCTITQKEIDLGTRNRNTL